MPLLLLAVCPLRGQGLPAADVGPVKYLFIRAGDSSTVKEVVMQKRRGEKRVVELTVFNLWYRREPALEEGQTRQLNPSAHNAGNDFLTTLSVLPDANTGKVTWKPVRPDTLPLYKKLLPREVGRMGFMAIEHYFASGKQLQEEGNYLKAFNIIPLVQRGERYYVPDNVVLTEFYRVIDFPTDDPAEHDPVSLNTGARQFTNATVREAVRAADQPSARYVQLAGALFLEKAANGAYHFWLYPAMGGMAASFHYVTKDLVFVPGTGVVAANYLPWRHHSEAESEFYTSGTWFKAVSVNGKAYEKGRGIDIK